MGVFYGLLAAVGWGAGDFVGTVITRRIGVLRTLLGIQIVGVIALAMVALALREEAPEWSSAWPAAVAAGLINVVAMTLLYRSFTVGTLSIVSPIASSYAVFLGLFAFVAGERLPGRVLLGAALLVVGVAFVARGAGGDGASLAGVPEAAGAAVVMALSFWLLDGVIDELGWLWTGIVVRIAQFGGLLVAVLYVRGQDGPFASSIPASLLPWIVINGLLDTLGLVGLSLGLERGSATTTAALSSLYAAVAVLLACLFLRERLARPQWVGVGTILIGVLLVSL